MCLVEQVFIDSVYKVRESIDIISFRIASKSITSQRESQLIIRNEEINNLSSTYSFEFSRRSVSK